MKKISYNPLWCTLINKGIKNKTDLKTLAGISPATLAKLSKDQEVSMSVLVKLSTALNVPLADIVETTEE
jgi:DNA-binding Xre family transcriptional regulator